MNSTVRRLRTALDDHAERPRYIETIPRRGYRFIGRLDSNAVRTANGRVEAPLADRVGLTALPIQSVEQEDGQAGAPPMREPGRRRSAARWAAVATVLVIGTGTAFWAGTGGAPSQPASSGERASSPRHALGVAREPAAQPAFAGPGSADARARERLARGRCFFQRRSAGDLVRAREHYEAALALDPTLAPAWAGLAGVHFIETVEGLVPPEEGLPKLRETAERALALDPRLVEAHLRLANYYGVTGDRPTQRRHLDHALELDASDPLALGIAASLAAADGRQDDAIGLQRRAVEVEPLAVVNRYNLASMLFDADRISEARAELEAILELTRDPASIAGLGCLIAVSEGRYEDALQLAQHAPRNFDNQQCRALAYHALHRPAEADAALAVLRRSEDAGNLVRVAQVYAHRGDDARAFEWLDRALKHSQAQRVFPPSGPDLELELNSPFLRPLHADPRWVALRAAAGASG